IPGDKRLLPRLLHVLVLGREVAARRVGRRRVDETDDHDRGKDGDEQTGSTGPRHGIGPFDAGGSGASQYESKCERGWSENLRAIFSFPRGGGWERGKTLEPGSSTKCGVRSTGPRAPLHIPSAHTLSPTIPIRSRCHLTVIP